MDRAADIVEDARLGEFLGAPLQREPGAGMAATAHLHHAGIESGEVTREINADHFATGYCSFMFGTIYQWVVAPDALDLVDLLNDFEKNTVSNLTQGRE